MDKEIREVIGRLEKELKISSSVTVSSQYFQFLLDLHTLIAYVKRRKQ